MPPPRFEPRGAPSRALPSSQQAQICRSPLSSARSAAGEREGETREGGCIPGLCWVKSHVSHDPRERQSGKGAATGGQPTTETLVAAADERPNVAAAAALRVGVGVCCYSSPPCLSLPPPASPPSFVLFLPSVIRLLSAGRHAMGETRRREEGNGREGNAWVNGRRLDPCTVVGFGQWTDEITPPWPVKPRWSHRALSWFANKQRATYPPSPMSGLAKCRPTHQ
jgi:hypothetical protein